MKSQLLQSCQGKPHPSLPQGEGVPPKAHPNHCKPHPNHPQEEESLSNRLKHSRKEFPPFGEGWGGASTAQYNTRSHHCPCASADVDVVVGRCRCRYRTVCIAHDHHCGSQHKLHASQCHRCGTMAVLGGLRRHGGVCGQDYHFAIFRYEKYKKHSFCVGFHHFFYNFALGKRDSASPCGYFSRLGAQFYSYGSYINKPTI